MITHIPHVDETQNYMVSYFINIHNFSYIISLHGHPIIWYLILKPFSMSNFGYPYTLLIINYIFILLAIIFFWNKTKLDLFIKIIITFSYMMINYFSVVARCYTIGILLLFIIAYLYREQLKKTILYALLLGLTANTSAMAAITVVGLSLIFLFKLLINHKNVPIYKIFLSLLILILFATFCLYPFLINKVYNFQIEKIWSFWNFFIPIKHNFLFVISYFLCIVYLLINSFRKNEDSKYYCIETLFLLFYSLISRIWFYFNVFNFLEYHFFWFFIDLIIIIMIQNSYKKYDKYVIYFCIFLTIVLYTPFNISYTDGDKDYRETGKEIQNNKIYKNSNIIVKSDLWGLLYEIPPYVVFDKTKTLINESVKYDYHMTYYPPLSNEELKKFTEESDKSVYMITSKEKPYKEIYNRKNKVRIYKLK